MALRDDLFDWLSGRPAWQQHLARALVRGWLDTPQRDQILRLVVREHGGPDDSAAPLVFQPFRIEDLSAPPGPAPARLLAIGDLVGVGAVAAAQQLTFEPNGMTVVYGPNAAGKSSYVRALKRACRTVDKDSVILANIFSPAIPAPRPSATIRMLVDGEEEQLVLDLTSPGPSELATISVFDARCAELYVLRRTTVEYVPSVLALLERLATTQDDLRRALEAEMATIEGRTPRFPEFAAGSSAVHQIVRSISAETDLDEVARLCQISEPERRRREELRVLLASAAAGQSKADAAGARAAAQQAAVLAQRLERLYELLGDASVLKLRGLAQEVAETAVAARLSREEFGSGAPPGVGSGPWRVMWDAARSFVQSAGYGPFPPPPGSAAVACPLCLQEISLDAAERLRHFQAHVESEVESQVESAVAALAGATAMLPTTLIADCQPPVLESIRAVEAGLAATVDGAVNAARERLAALTAGAEAILHAELAEMPPDPCPRLRAWSDAQARRAGELEALADAAGEQRRRTELLELEARELLAVRQIEIAAWVRDLQLLRAMKSAFSALHTSAVTRKQRELTSQVVTETLRENLRRELGALHFEHLDMDVVSHGQVGSTQVELRPRSAPDASGLGDVLSEGEKRALSIAFFLAEVGAAEHGGGIVLDDPVSSTDQERQRYIADRLCQEAGRRQVIVFTHDIAFVLSLQKRAEEYKIPLAMHGMWRDRLVAGRVDEQAPFETLKFNRRVGQLRDEVQNWPSFSSFDAQWNAVCNLYRRMRMTWERGVEELLFAEVVQRFSPEVKTQSLGSVNITDELVEMVSEGMTRCSTFVHDQPPGQQPTYTRADLEQDVEKLVAFGTVARSRSR